MCGCPDDADTIDRQVTAASVLILPAAEDGRDIGRHPLGRGLDRVGREVGVARRRLDLGVTEKLTVHRQDSPESEASEATEFVLRSIDSLTRVSIATRA